jgi:dihydroorotase
MILIKNGRLIDPKNNIDECTDILLKDRKVFKIGKSISEPKAKKINAKNKIVCPGLIDLQVHLREPGREGKETILTGMRSAIRGGVTSLVSMPNLLPVADDQSIIAFQKKRAQEINLGNIFPTGAITIGQEGKSMTEMQRMKNFGAVAVTDDGGDVQNAGLLEKAMQWATTVGLPVFSHCEEESMHNKGVMHEGEWSTKMGLSGISAETEDYGVFRSVLLAEKTRAKLHVLHCSTRNGLDAIANAKSKGNDITCETCPQYFSLTDEICKNYNTFGKMYPPIRNQEHQQAVIERLKDGTIDCISTDHAPHPLREKYQPFALASPGSVGLETSLAVGITYLVRPGHIPLPDLLKKMTINPARVIDIERGHLGIGSVADITVFDMEKEWIVDPNMFESKGKNCVFSGMKLFGKVTDVLVNGEIKMREEKM